MEHLDSEVDINSTCKIKYQNFSQSKSGYYKLNKHKPRFNEGCSKLLDQTKQTQLQLLWDSSEISGDNLNNV
jgi:hypothetical protein